MDLSSIATIDENARRRFEAAWRAGRPEPVEAFLPGPEHPHYLATLEELLHIEMEFAWKRHAADPEGQQTLVSVEHYLGRFPCLNQQPIVLRLVRQEFRLRHDHGDHPTLAEYQARFPQFVLSGQEIAPIPPGHDRTPVIPGYEILGELGLGGMGVVYRARHLKLGRIVALKMILGGAAFDAEARTRFRAEAEAVARLQHPHIVQIHDVGEHEGRPWCSLEFVEGGSLAARLAGTPQPARHAAEVVEQLARAMHQVHQKGIIHRDLKPHNVLLTAEGVAKVTDFGLAKRLQEDSGQTKTGSVVGSPSYMAPEQAVPDRGRVGPAADIYGLGAILYEMLTGRPPFKGESILDTLQQVVADDPVPPRHLLPRIPRDLETICLKCLHKDPRQRYLSAQDLADDLGRFLRGEPIKARPVGALTRAVKWARRHPAVAALSAFSIAAVVVGFALVLNQWFLTEEARKAERDQRRRAELATEDAKDKARQEQESRHAAEEQLYLSNIPLAHREWQAGNAARTETLLDECPKRLRGWEWHYLKRQFGAARFIQRNHGAGKVVLAFSHDGKWLASAGQDGVIRVCDSATGKARFVLKGHKDTINVPELPLAVPKGIINEIAWSSDGKYLASAGRDGTVRLWGASSGKQERVLAKHLGPVISLSFSPDGNRIATGGADRTVRVWEVATGKELFVFKQHKEPVFIARFSPDGRLIASMDTPPNGTVLVWTADKGKVERLVKEPSTTWIAFAPDGKLLVSVGNNIHGINVVTGMVDYRTRTTVIPVFLSPSSDGKRMIAGDKHFQGVLAFSKKRRFVALGHRAVIESVAFAPDGQRFASASLDGEVRVWDWDNAESRDYVQLPFRSGHHERIAFSPDNRFLARGLTPADWRGEVIGGASVVLADAITGKDVRTFACTSSSVAAVAFSPDGRWLAADDGGLVRLWTVADGKEKRQWRGRPAGWTIVDTILGSSLAFDGNRLCWADSRGTVRVWNVTTGKEVRSFKLPLGGRRGRVEFSADGRHLAFGPSKNSIEVRATRTGKVLRKFTHNLGFAPVLAFSRGDLLAAAGESTFGTASTVIVWNWKTGNQVIRFPGHTVATGGLAFSPDERRLATTGWDLTVRLWDLASGRELLLLGRLPVLGKEVAFSPDGQLLACSAPMLNVWIWNGAKTSGKKR